MPILNIVRCSAFTSQQVNNCLATLLESDSILLIDDGGYNLTHPSLLAVVKRNEVFVINEHAVARALAIPPNIIPISMKEMKDLVFSHHSVITWQ